MKYFKDCPFEINGDVVELDGADWKPLKACTGFVFVPSDDMCEECIHCKHWMFNEHIDDIHITVCTPFYSCAQFPYRICIIYI